MAAKPPRRLLPEYNPYSVIEAWYNIDHRTLAQAKADLHEAMLWTGGEPNCPCCGQRAKIYARSLRGVPTAFLLLLFNHRGVQWTKTRDLLRWLMEQHKNRDDFPALIRLFSGATAEHYMSQHWGFLEQTGGIPDYPISSEWRVTEAGVAFIRGEISVPSHLLVFDGKCVGPPPHSKPISFDQAIVSAKFDFNELMELTPN